jgi:hypothetical protein
MTAVILHRAHALACGGEWPGVSVIVGQDAHGRHLCSTCTGR